MDLAECKSLLGHCEWADAEIWSSVLALPEADTEIADKLYHLHVVQWAYLQIWRGASVKPPERTAFQTADALRNWAREHYRELTSYLGTLGGGIVTETVRFPWADGLVRRFGKAGPASWSESVLQIAMHSGYHRGQVAHRLRQLGAEPPLTDFIAWVWQGKPVADWGDDEAA